MSNAGSYPWFRMYVEFLDDPKIIALAFEDQRHFIGVLALKRKGILDSGAAPEMLDRIVAQRLWIDHAVIREVKKRLMAPGLISEDWQPLGWDKRQSPSDSSTARVTKHREKKKQAAAAGAGEQGPEFGNGDGNVSGNDGGNGGETLQKRESNGLDIDRDKDKEGETVEELEPVGSQHAAEASPSAPPAKPEPKAKTSTAGKRLADDWRLPKSWGEWAIAERPDMTPDEVRRQAAMFADHWHAATGKDGRKADWEATWRNWIRRANLPRNARPAAGGGTLPNKQEALEQRNRSVGAAWAAQGQGGSHAAA